MRARDRGGQSGKESEKMERKKRWDQTKRYKDLKKSLIADLEAAGINRLPFSELVEQYMAFWVQLQDLDADITARGVQVPYVNGRQTGVTDNKSVSAKIRVSAQMNDILKNLGYSDRAKRAGAQAGADGGEDDVL